MYMRVSASREPVPIAEFRWAPEAGVSLAQLDPKRGDLAREIYDHGIESPSSGRFVPASDGPAFMRTLLEPTRLTYYGFVDETDN